MPTDLSVQAVGPVLGSSENPAQPKPETFTPPAQAPPQSPPVVIANPTLRFDAASGLVVIEYRDANGDVTTSIPTLRQIEAYRQWSRPLPGQTAAPTSMSGAQASANRKT
ncbi:MAG TPA: hypothetical protein VMU81_24655 [Acetobacteraceae bacterium]|jgi:hypothetical protein|nr:hypothetical protein [Acetobacteraceae bacterium]